MSDETVSDEEPISEASAARRQASGEIPLHAMLDLQWAWPDKGVEVAEVK